MNYKILVSIGTRPEAIKMVPLIKALEKDPSVTLELCVTAQHRSMLDQVLDIFNINSNYDLNIMKPEQDLSDITSKIILGLRDVLLKSMPDIVLVHGDTTTTLGSALAAFYAKIPIGHVEAGLRTNDIYSPWPEEVNRQLTSKLARYHFAPTPKNQKTLLNEGIDNSNILVCGNTGIDTLFLTVERINNLINVKNRLLSMLKEAGLKIDISRERYVLITGHRRENFGKGFENICIAISRLADQNKNIHFVYPVHLNPNVLIPVTKHLKNIKNIHLLEPLSYEPFVLLMMHCHLILTDSGGIQEEAPSLGKPVLVMRESTERPEAVEAGTVKLVGTDSNTIINEVELLLNEDVIYQSMSRAHNPYGNGYASEKIVNYLKDVLKKESL